MASKGIPIDCPFHKKQETLRFLDSYDLDNFDGEVWCGVKDDQDKAKLHIRLKNNKIQKIEVKAEPHSTPITTVIVNSTEAKEVVEAISRGVRT
jgi:hypothetical protein